jgi:hypothetical protein
MAGETRTIADVANIGMNVAVRAFMSKARVCIGGLHGSAGW